ncbi:MAG: SGNH/GDSL hydrolase family protein, partial [Alphaproteobacteria bacterium]|nr:SGNH/GDSL hydrolase family protein [Alphaproteobacteria bacterium]
MASLSLPSAPTGSKPRDRKLCHADSLIAASLLGLAALAISAPIAAAGCAAPDNITRFRAPTPALTSAFQSGQPVRIVAFGSSSTEGAGASASDRTYPARLQFALRLKFPEHNFKVINRGKGGELASHMLARLDRDVIAENPTLVIWQTGVNDAIHGIDMAEFRNIVEAGVNRMKGAGIDVILLDQQYYPRSAKVPNYNAYLKLIR